MIDEACYCSDFLSSGLPCPPGQCPNSPEAWRHSFWRRIAALERQYGKGPTYGLRDRQLILAKIVPEWLFRTAYTGPTPEVRDRAHRAALALERLYTDAFTDWLEKLRSTDEGK